MDILQSCFDRAGTLENSAWLSNMLHRGGMTLQDIGLIFQLTRERVRQIAKSLEIDSSCSSRSALWYANRYKQPLLDNKEWLEKNLAELGSVSAMAYILKMGERALNTVLKKHGIDKTKSLRPKLIELACEYCGEKFTRKRCIFNRNVKLGCKHFFCNRRCFRKWAGVDFGLKNPVTLQKALKASQEAQKKRSAPIDQFIIANWKNMSDKELAAILKLSQMAIQRRRLRLGLKRVPRWSE